MTTENTIFKTEDGSHTIKSNRFNESYHSKHGAIQESVHIFIESAFKQCAKSEISIFEVGFGTGLNALLTYIEAKKLNKKVYYETIELYPISKEDVDTLNYSEIFDKSDEFKRLHEPENIITLSPTFSLKKNLTDFTNFKFSNKYDVIYFDAFSPETQPEMWTKELFHKVYDSLNVNGILTTYVAKGEIRRRLIEVGFRVEKLEGPPGKRHILRAIK